MPGADMCIANLIATAARLDKETKAAAKKAADEVMEKSKERYCPIDTGALKKSAKVEVSKDGMFEYRVRLSYNTPYAVYVHEIPYYHHPVGSWKYLDIPFKQANFLQMISAGARL